MFEQIITEWDVRQLIHKHELVTEKINRDIDDYEQVIKKIYDNISTPNFQINIYKTQLYDKPLYIADNIESKIIMRYIDKLIKRVYKVKQANRDRIIKQLISILYSTNEFYIIKLDISSFYESINSNRIIKHLKDDGIISYQNISYIENIIKNTCQNGLPRGVAFSSSLSEIYLRKFDNFLKQHLKISYFARYVDDIIIISSENIIGEIKSYLKRNLNLEINGIKKKIIPVRNNEHLTCDFDFLGYKFYLDTFATKNDKKRNVKIAIADSKIKKIQNRIVKSCLIYLINGRFDDLYDRMKLILSNYQLKSNENGILMTGIYYNYKEITDKSALLEINRFKYLLIHGNSRLSKKLKAKLDTKQIEKLDKINICSGFYSRINIHISEQRIIKLYQVLKYV